MVYRIAPTIPITSSNLNVTFTVLNLSNPSTLIQIAHINYDMVTHELESEARHLKFCVQIDIDEY